MVFWDHWVQLELTGLALEFAFFFMFSRVDPLSFVSVFSEFLFPLTNTLKNHLSPYKLCSHGSHTKKNFSLPRPHLFSQVPPENTVQVPVQNVKASSNTTNTVKNDKPGVLFLTFSPWVGYGYWITLIFMVFLLLLLEEKRWKRKVIKRGRSLKMVIRTDVWKKWLFLLDRL